MLRREQSGKLQRVAKQKIFWNSALFRLDGRAEKSTIFYKYIAL